MKNTKDNNQNDEPVETMSFADFFLQLSFKYVLMFFAALWVFAMAVLIAFLELSK